MIEKQREGDTWRATQTVGHPPTQGVGDQVKEGVSQQASGCEAQQHLEEVLVLVGVGLHRDEEEAEEGSSADQQGGPYSLENGGTTATTSIIPWWLLPFLHRQFGSSIHVCFM